MILLGGQGIVFAHVWCGRAFGSNARDYSRVVLLSVSGPKSNLSPKRSSTKVQVENETNGPVPTGLEASSLSVVPDQERSGLCH